MPRGGKRENSGRKLGSQTTRTQEIVAEASKKGITPLEYMLQVLRDPSAKTERRDEMAKAAAPYMHSRMPIAILPPGEKDKNGSLNKDDKKILDLYMRGLHEETDAN